MTMVAKLLSQLVPADLSEDEPDVKWQVETMIKSVPGESMGNPQKLSFATFISLSLFLFSENVSLILIGVWISDA